MRSARGEKSQQSPWCPPLVHNTTFLLHFRTFPIELSQKSLLSFILPLDVWLCILQFTSFNFSFVRKIVRCGRVEASKCIQHVTDVNYKKNSSNISRDFNNKFYWKDEKHELESFIIIGSKCVNTKLRWVGSISHVNRHKNGTHFSAWLSYKCEFSASWRGSEKKNANLRRNKLSAR